MSFAHTSFLVSAAERLRLDEVDRLFGAGAAAVPALLAGLGDSSWTVRRAVVAALGALGDEAALPLIDVLIGTRNDETVLAAAVEALVSSTGAVESGLESLLSHPDPAVGADVAQILGRRQRAAAIPALIRLAKHANDNVAVAAIEGLGRVGSHAAVEALLATLESGKFFRVFPAIAVLGRSGDPRVVKPLVALAHDPRFTLEVVRALGLTGDVAAVAPLAERLIAATDPADVADVAVVAQALLDLDAEHQRRYGPGRQVRDALRLAVDGAAISRVLAAATAGAADHEKVALAAVLGMLASAVGIPALLALALEGGAVGAAAQQALNDLGADSGPLLRDALRAADSDTRRLLLPIMRSPAAGADIVACLDDEDAEVRSAAADALARTGSVAGVPALFARLSDPSALVVQSAVAAIQSLGSAETESLALASAHSPEANVRRWGMRVLAYFGYPRALSVLLEAMSDRDLKVQEAAIQGLAFIDSPKARDALLNASRHSLAAVRAVGYRSLGQAMVDVRGEAALIRGLSDPDDWARYYACQAAGKLRLQAAIGMLIERLGDGAGQVQLAAVEALSHFDDRAAHEALERVAETEQSDLRQAALIGLGIARVGKPVVLLAVDSPDPSTRLVALSSLAGFGDDDDTPILRRAASDDAESVRNAALVALAARTSPEATRALIDLLGGGRLEETQVQEALTISAASRLQEVVHVLGQADDRLAPLLAAVLARMQDPASPGALVTVLEGAGVTARRAAAVTLGGLRTPAAMTALRLASKRDPDPDVRQICAAAVGVAVGVGVGVAVGVD